MQIYTYATLVLTMFLWGGTFIGGRALAATVTPASAAFLRFSIATAALAFFTYLIDGKLSFPPRKQWPGLLLLGLTGVFSYNVLFFTGLQYIEAGRASLIIALNPLVITVFATFFLREPLSFRQFCGVILSLTGAVYVISNGSPGLLLSGNFGRGELAILGCVGSWATYSLIGRAILSTLSPLATVFYSSLIGTLLLLWPAQQEGVFQNISSISLLDWSILLFLGFFATALGFSLYYRAIKKIGATRTGVFINLVPLFSIILSWFILGESIKPLVITGGIILLAGVGLTNFHKKKTLPMKGHQN